MSSTAMLASAAGSCAIVAASTPIVRRLAVAKGVVDHPGGHKSHIAPVPYLGGLAIMVGAVVAHLAVVGVAGRTSVILLAAVMLGLVGAVDDRRNLHPLPRLAAQLAAAAAALAVGVRVQITGNAIVDSIATLVWIVAMTNAVNFLDNMDGLASCVAAASAVSAFVLASAAGQRVVATAASALFGACLGFLFYNRRPASIYMGDAGSLFLGYLLAIVVNQVDPAQAPPRSWVVPALLLGIPVLDTTTVMVARWRHGLALHLGGRDHLSHRLVARGWSPTDAVLALVGYQALLGGLAVLIGRGALPLWLGIIVSAGLLGSLLLLCLSARVYDRPRIR
ncbi:MAG: MraY family glycosyltransferase [Acidimicrobiales bacterium]